MRESTKKASSIRRYGARIAGIVTGGNIGDPAAWDALAECDLAEFRADLFEPGGIPAAFSSFLAERDRRALSFGTLFTLRLRRDGGRWPDSEAASRPAVWERMLDGKSAPVPDWIDIEVEHAGGLPAGFREKIAAAGARLIVSHHDFAGCPPRDRLRGLLDGMLALRPDGIKFAVTCASRPRLIDLMAFAREAAQASPMVSVLSMGAAGRAMRVLGPILGCPLAYGFLSGAAVAPGQLSAAELGRLLDGFSASLPADLAAPGSETRLLDWAEARLQGDPIG